jgi:sialate O-acetylesterase
VRTTRTFQHHHQRYHPFIMSVRLRIAILAILLTPPSLQAQSVPEPLLADVFQDRAVLQRERPIRVFGVSAAGDAITVTLGAASSTTKADAEGRWTATLPAMPAGGPYTLAAKSVTGREQRAEDVLVGDVWLCSGQSNMDMAVRGTRGGMFEARAATGAPIRLLQVPHESSAVPLARFKSPVAWKVADPETIAAFSGTCYYFARELQKTVKTPMGLVNASWGGANIQTWITAGGLKTIGGFDDQISLLAQYANDPVAATARLGESWQAWWRSKVNGAAGHEPWQPGAPGDWKPVPAALGNWKKWGIPALAAHDGMVWYRRTITLTKAQAAGSVTLALGGIDEVDETWVNGRPIANTFGWGTPRTYPVPPGLLHEGENTVVVNVLSTWDMGGLLGPLDAMKVTGGDGSVVPIGDGWQFLQVATEIGTPPRAPWESVGGVMSIGNAMVAPLGAFGLRGVAWYQGESNAAVENDYERLLAGLMAGWRQQFATPDLPFLVVQLPNFGAFVTGPVASDWASLREAQRRAVANDPHAGLAVTIDVGQANELHPPDKQSVGARLARVARKVVYGEAIAPSGPRPVSATRAGGTVTIEFTDVEQGLVVYSGARPNAFELCGPTQATCRFADARLEGTRVIVEGPDAASATRVRHCWGDAPICTLYDRTGLPAGPFEIDVR